MRSQAYLLVTAGYWAFTITDGALRMLVLLHFNELGYSAPAIAFLFVAYELMGVVTNLLGGWLGSRRGLDRTLVWGLGLQVVTLVALTAHDESWGRGLAVAFVMGMQAVSGIAKDLTKMSSKSAVKALTDSGSLFRVVAVLTGSKNALKGVGFFVGGALLSWLGYDGALLAMAAVLALTLLAVQVLLDDDLGVAKRKPPLRSIMSKSAAINRLSLARLFLFGARDVWFVVAVPVFLADALGWSHAAVGGSLAVWVIGYGAVQSITPGILGRTSGSLDPLVAARHWAAGLTVLSGTLALLVTLDLHVTVTVLAGLIIFGIVFAVNSSLHSYLVLAFSDDEQVALDVGFYYSANALGRLIGTLGSGLLYLWGGLAAALCGSAAFLLSTWIATTKIPPLPIGVRVSLADVEATD